MKLVGYYGGEVMPEGQIRMYGTKWCPDCSRAKQVMSKYNIPYQFIDIEQDADAADYVIKVNQGNRSVPTIVFPDGSVLVEPGNAVLEKKLAAYK
jgi:mycoredoxin